MKVILTIGYLKFLMPSSAAAERVISGLSKAVVLAHDYDSKSRDFIYWPADGHREAEIKLELVKDGAVHKRKPLLALPAPEETQHG